MKKIFTIIASLLLFASCNNRGDKKPTNETAKFIAGGYVEDNPDSIAKITVITSGKGFGDSTTQLQSFAHAKGRPIKDNIPPTVSITNPPNGATVSGSIIISVTASDNVGVTLVQVYADDILLTSSSWNTLNVPNGLKTIVANAYDARGNKGTTSISVTVNNPIIQPPPPPPPPTTIDSGSFYLQTTVADKQGSYQCAAFATAHAQGVNRIYNNNENIQFSPQFIYNKSVNDYGWTCTSGMSYSSTLGILQTYGVCKESTFPFVDNCPTQPGASALLEASNYKISGFTKFLLTDTALMKQVLLSHHAIMIAVLIDNDVMAGNACIWKTDGSGNLPHSVIITGWNNYLHAWQYMNSEGGSWCQGGKGWIDYDLFYNSAKAIRDCVDNNVGCSSTGILAGLGYGIIIN